MRPQLRFDPQLIRALTDEKIERLRSEQADSERRSAGLN